MFEFLSRIVEILGIRIRGNICLCTLKDNNVNHGFR